LRADPRRVFTGASVDNGIDENLQVGSNMSGKQSKAKHGKLKSKKKSNLDWVLVGEEVDDLERMCNNADGEKLLSIITTLHHQAEKRTHSAWPDDTTISYTQPVYKAFNDGHLSLLELLFSVSTGGMGKINSMADLNIVCQRNVLDFDA
jgi:hypothetical protein